MSTSWLGDLFLPSKDDRSYVPDVMVVLSKTALKIGLALLKLERDITDPWERALALLSIEPALKKVSTATSLA